MNKLHKHPFLPQNYIAEETLIGVLLIYPNIINKIKYIVPKEYFFLEKNQLMYLHLTQITKKENSNIIEIFCELESKKILSNLGGLQSVMKTMKKSQIFISSYKLYNYIEDVINILKTNYLKRLIIQFGHNLIKIGHVQNVDNQYLYRKTLSYINKIENLILSTNKNGIQNIKEIISERLIDIKYGDIHKNNKTKLIKSGLTEVDKIINKLPQSSLIIIAGRPSIGKTSLAINIAYNAFLNQQVNLLIFSLEMTSQEIFNKILCIGSKVNINEKSTKKFSQNEWNQISRICNKLLKNNIYINDQNNINIQLIENITKNIKKNIR